MDGYNDLRKLRKRNKSTVMECEIEEKMKKLKYMVQDMLDENFKVTESPKIK